MRLASTVTVAACFWLATTALASGPVWAQGVDSGLEVRVNPYAFSGLLYPGERRGPIQLHMPGKRHIARARPKQVAVAAPPPEAAPAPEPAPAPVPVPKKKRAAPPPPPQRQAAQKPAQPQSAQPQSAPQPQADASPYFGTPNLSNVFGAQPQQPKPAPQPQKIAKASPPPPASSGEAGLTKRSVILFAKDASDPAEGALGAIKFLANDLTAAMTGAGSRIELQAFGGGKGDKSSDARRLSLKRALSIRQVLIEDGVSPDRIDVRAMGGADDSGPADRVDVYVRA
jgi:outer membrane protein OmpA-like peptidoglycan-associated protein